MHDFSPPPTQTLPALSCLGATPSASPLQRYRCQRAELRADVRRRFSPDCVNRRQKTLRYLIDDKDRAWVTAQPPAEAYASGVRLFALKSKKKELSARSFCTAATEADRAPGVLRGPDGSNLTPAQVSRG